MSRSVQVLLNEILEAIELIGLYTRGLDYFAFASHIEKQDAVVRRLEIIGKAVKGVPEDLRSAYPSVPWRDIAGARDVLIHEYFRVDLEMTWAMVQTDLPKLETQLRAILKQLT